MASKLDAFRELIEKGEMSDEDIADMAGVKPPTVAKYRKALLTGDDAPDVEESEPEETKPKPKKRAKASDEADELRDHVRGGGRIKTTQKFNFRTTSLRSGREVIRPVQVSIYKGNIADVVIDAAVQADCLHLVEAVAG